MYIYLLNVGMYCWTDMRVMFLQRVLPHYRISFFDKLNTLLFDKGIELVVVYGQEAEGAST